LKLWKIFSKLSKFFLTVGYFLFGREKKSNLPLSDAGRDGVDRKNGDAPLMGASLLHINNE